MSSNPFYHRHQFINDMWTILRNMWPTLHTLWETSSQAGPVGDVGISGHRGDVGPPGIIGPNDAPLGPIGPVGIPGPRDHDFRWQDTGPTYVDAFVSPGLPATLAWLNLLTRLLNFGHPVSPRGYPTRELLGQQMIIDMNHPCVYSRVRKVSPQFACGETTWYLQGRDDLEFIQKFAPSYDRFSDDGRTLYGAYGPSLVAQLPYVINCLREDPDSRQAVMTLWHRNPPASKDIPCTISSQFIVRRSPGGSLRLHLIHNMRSNDAWVGFIYDVFSFSMLAAIVALSLRTDTQYRDLKLGNLIFTAGSQHIYCNRLESAQRVLDTGEFVLPPRFDLDLYDSPAHLQGVLADPAVSPANDLISHWFFYHRP